MRLAVILAFTHARTHSLIHTRTRFLQRARRIHTRALQFLKLIVDDPTEREETIFPTRRSPLPHPSFLSSPCYFAQPV